MGLKIEVVPGSGFCGGVSRAVEIAKKSAPCYTLGPLIHNSRVIRDLELLGVVSINSLEELPENGTLILRTHGSPPDLYKKLNELKIMHKDATCPSVLSMQRLITKDSEEGRLVILFGDREHPEIKAAAAWCRECVIISSVTELEEMFNSGEISKNSPITLASQTTALSAKYKICQNFIKKLCTNAKILDTICEATEKRQRSTAELSRRVDVMVVVGDLASANTKHLAGVCECPYILVKGRGDLALPPGVRYVGITAGASAPSAIIEEVILQMSDEIKNGQSFEEMLEPFLRPLVSGERITGTVIGVSPAEIQVDLGSKHAAYIPANEFSDDPNINLQEAVKVGDEIESYIQRVNDGEGTVMLSKRRLDAAQGWEDAESAQESGTILEGYVTEENKGGVVVSVKGVRVFVPASQTGLPRETPMGELLKKKVRLRVTEFNRQRRRVVGSIRAVTVEERRAASEAVWSTIEVGKRYNGSVRSVTPYGVFVDIGGVDGLVHVTQLAWHRVKDPKEIVKPGEQLPVTVIEIDREKQRISLSARNPEDDPWLKFIDNYDVGIVVKVRVNKLMPFGAFAEIIPGVDGLIHISQITDHRVGKISDAISEGDEVDVKITEIDYQNKKISLSASALMETPSNSVYGDDSPDEIVAIASEEETLFIQDEGSADEAE